MVNSRQKGKRGELEAAKWLREHGVEARRSQQYCGINSDADLSTSLDDKVHFEVKRVQALNIDKALQQATSDKKPEQTPVVMHRRNGEKWKMTFWAEDAIELLK